MTRPRCAMTSVPAALWFAKKGPRGSNLRALCFGLASLGLTGALRFILGVLCSVIHSAMERGPQREPGGTVRSPRGDAGEDPCPEGLLAVALIIIAWCGFATPASAAFEVRDASPAALGAVSIDLDAGTVVGDPGERLGLSLSASHAALYQVEGLTAEQVSIAWDARAGRAALSYSQVGVPGARENRMRVAVRESGTKRIALGLEVERLDLALDGEPRVGGWAVGGGVRARLTHRSLDLEVAIDADRLFRGGDLDRLGVAPSIPIVIELRSGVVSAAWVDRWEGDGRRSPRVVLDVPLARTAWVRFGHGEHPSRIGAALGVRLGRVEFSAGRLDPSAGGVVGAASLQLLPSVAIGGR